MVNVVYFEHATDPVTFGLFMVLYYASIPLAIIVWAFKYYPYIQKREYHLKELGAFLLLAFMVTSFSGYSLLNQYLYLHSPFDSISCYTSSCVLSSALTSEYGFSEEELKSYGLPSVGVMTVFRISDVVVSKSLLKPKRLNNIVITRAWLILPVVDVYVYHVSTGPTKRIVGKERFYFVWPLSPGSFLSEKFDADFTVLITGNSGAGA
ncbi:hypothetical protein [Thermococcus kodakarensis]|uniref:hypothetical protein n=1 Tax=Thermococcus kodakarensis TaxID=311400 RepID=UPI001E528976|nr:hypothetical protein [Thermococcus kodakarensis]WCN29578.1 hypothetical protein POG21_06615 [Thermococcus kodakarensis]